MQFYSCWYCDNMTIEHCVVCGLQELLSVINTTNENYIEN